MNTTLALLAFCAVVGDIAFIATTVLYFFCFAEYTKRLFLVLGIIMAFLTIAFNVFSVYFFAYGWKAVLA